MTWDTRRRRSFARRIAKIDPYLPVTIFEDGVTATNVGAFLRGLDLLIEECDGLQIKHDVRQLAKGRGVNVVFAADERGFLSVEPYGVWTELRPFHGRIAAPARASRRHAVRLPAARERSPLRGGTDRPRRAAPPAR